MIQTTTAELLEERIADLTAAADLLAQADRKLREVGPAGKALRRRLGGCRGAVLLELDVQQRLYDGLNRDRLPVDELEADRGGS